MCELKRGSCENVYNRTSLTQRSLRWGCKFLLPFTWSDHQVHSYDQKWYRGILQQSGSFIQKAGRHSQRLLPQGNCSVITAIIWTVIMNFSVYCRSPSTWLTFFITLRHNRLSITATAREEGWHNFPSMSTYLLCVRSILSTRSTHWQRCLLSTEKICMVRSKPQKNFKCMAEKFSFPHVFPNQKHKIHCATGNQKLTTPSPSLNSSFCCNFISELPH